mmetsp:Transcript_29482/g.63870  ORF Transcript_29482/g.63870 Transcript_29482/m.63870 type:complete len:284 (+) Transcript_29482:50-901(+)
MATHIMDIDEELLLRHFCLEEECKEVRKWIEEKGHVRPSEIEARIEGAGKLRKLSNDRFEAGDYQEAMLLALGSLHFIDFSQANSVTQTEEQKGAVVSILVPLLSNLAMIFLKRSGDGYNAARAADLGLQQVKLLSTQEASTATKFRAKLLYRRGLARGQSRDFAAALPDLREAAKLMPENREIRKVLENCKQALKQDNGEPDDQWRGLLTETPEVLRCQARLKRKFREAKLAFWGFLGRRTTIVLILGPLISFGLQAAVVRYFQRDSGDRESINQTTSPTSQ